MPRLPGQNEKRPSAKNALFYVAISLLMLVIVYAMTVLPQRG